MNFEQLVPSWVHIYILLGIGLGSYVLWLIGRGLEEFIFRPRPDTAKARELDIYKARELAHIKTEGVVAKIEAISKLPESSQVAAIKILQVNAFGEAPNLQGKLLDLGTREAGGFLSSILGQSVEESIVAVEKLKASGLWDKVQPLLVQLMQKTLSGARPAAPSTALEVAPTAAITSAAPMGKP